MSNQPLVQYASRTDVGMRRAANQDSLAVRLCKENGEWQTCGHLFVVADGMGGHSVGDLASRITVETLPLAYSKIDADSIAERLLESIKAANRAISDKARENPEFADMGTTCSALTLSPFGAFVGHVGDSRVYRVRGGEIEQLTFDHSLQWEMIRQGRATAANVDMLHPRNVITRCLGPDQNVQIDIEGPFHVQAGDRFVICSDGLTNHVSDTEIGAIAGNLPPTEASRLLIDLTNCRGGSDNVTVVLANVDRFPPIAGPVVDQPSPKQSPDAAADAKAKRKSRRILASKISLYLFLILGTFGLVLLALNRIPLGLSLICPALILGFVRFIFLTSGQPDAEEEENQEPSAEKKTVEMQPTASKAPYRAESARIQPQFLEFLSAAHSELTQAAKENDWQVNFDSLAQLNSEAGTAAEDSRPVQCLESRAKAIDMLMKELYSKTRR